MAEYIVLDTPINVRPGSSRFRIAAVHIDVIEGNLQIVAQEIDQGGAFVGGGTSITRSETGDTAMAAIRALNKIDCSTKSLQTRLLERMRDDGTFGPGTISGAPD